jgi:hypothetical protein
MFVVITVAPLYLFIPVAFGKTRSGTSRGHMGFLELINNIGVFVILVIFFGIRFVTRLLVVFDRTLLLKTT